MKNINILLAEDEQEIADILIGYLSKEGFSVTHARDGREAMASFNRVQPHFVVLDIRMPGMDGWEVLTGLRKISDVPIMMLTASDTDIDKVHALRIGADDYIVKPFNPAEVIARIYVILRRMPFYITDKNKDIFKTENLIIDLSTHSVVIKNSGEEVGNQLTSTEYKILTHLICSPKRVFTRREIMEKCLPEGEVSDRTVDSHISKLRKKLTLAGLVGVPESIRGFGYRLGD